MLKPSTWEVRESRIVVLFLSLPERFPEWIIIFSSYSHKWKSLLWNCTKWSTSTLLFFFRIEIKVWVTIILHQWFVLVIDNLELNLTISHFGKLHALFDEIDSPFLEANHSCFWIVNFFYYNFTSAHLFITLGIIQLYL